ncbi:SDR family NAD(P)-dependent oxidoreductase [Massilia sp. TW-1]|uniref:SDR family NAD(P)-dependent oxidoreductase n=1 Tax=Telluria antibiotica TaxID=2717319 RepID=A0ABX0PHK1_9BURK|nr:SDR family NAD(P)-dependent oxidoreductase [Telluria antibiotica]NIA56933.1 SDR family NAD(P)-dependent oxidoreductase [Telluria antibiotica]
MKHTEQQRTVLLLGASRGIGLGLVTEYLARGWRVIATQRSLTVAPALCELAADADGALTILSADIDRPDDIAALARRLEGITLDLLFVVAGVSDDPNQTIGQISTDEFTRVMVTNALSPLRAIERLAEHVRADGSIAVMSSALGSVAGNTTGGYEAYRASKAALNMLMRSYAARAGGNRSLLALMPGWVKTDMGGPDAPVEVKDSTAGLADTIEKHAGQPGLVFVDYQDNQIAW